ncbi:MAG: 23S rRNA (uracil(1939)-C(5))-methyltransferase RlmD [Bacteroidales bacterium]|nr:23S rRNA (uracil(1939)-C(5))-methyltransferase RlmD [Bacteroidales bacterium]
MVGRNKKLPKLTGLEIVDISSDGRAVGRTDNRVVFIPKLVPGDVVDVQVIRKRKSYFEAVVENFQKQSDLRVEPFCEHFGPCGGCKWQHMSYAQQLHYKQKQVREQLVRIGNLEIPEIRPILASEKTRFYRNKLEYSFCDRRWFEQSEIDSAQEITQIEGLGFHAPGRFDRVLQIEKCYLQDEPSNAIRNSIHEFAQTHKIPYYNPRQHTGLLRNLMIRITTTGEVMCVLIVADMTDAIRELLEHVKQNFPEIDALLYVINQKKNDSIYDLNVDVFHGKETITEELDGLKFQIAAKSFFQTNTTQTELLYNAVRELAEIKADDLVYDLYSGAGSISLYLARFARKVVGVEIVEEAINDAWKNAELNQIKNVEFFAGDMKDVLTPDFVKTHGVPDVLVLDPPRAGMHKDVVSVIAAMSPKRIVYVSCNPATQARDIALLGDEWKLTAVQPVDMFPHTHHVENIVLLEQG